MRGSIKQWLVTGMSLIMLGASALAGAAPASASSLTWGDRPSAKAVHYANSRCQGYRRVLTRREREDETGNRRVYGWMLVYRSSHGFCAVSASSNRTAGTLRWQTVMLAHCGANHAAVKAGHYRLYVGPAFLWAPRHPSCVIALGSTHSRTIRRRDGSRILYDAHAIVKYHG